MSSHTQAKPKSNQSLLTLGALGVVYGDIGTSPLYAFKMAFAHGMAPSPENILATLSALFWSIFLIISVKYILVVLRFDNDGEGGVLALTALAHRLTRENTKLASVVIGLGIFAAALFYGDAVITPAITVLGAVEGLKVATPHLEHWVVPIALGILIGVFMFQKAGTAKVGKFFGPIAVVWFLTLGGLGVRGILQHPEVLAALNPLLALNFAWQHPGAAFVLMSAVFLTMTGGEALYADMGHFGVKPVRLAWFGLVWPALILNYFGQGALVLGDPEAAVNPFYLLAPDWMLMPLVALATTAAVIASQATITGAFSMTLQASRLGYLPRLYVRHTSDTERGQIFIPSVNALMLVAVIVLVLQFKSSDALAAAYGIAVSGTMIITSILMLVVTTHLGRRGKLLGWGLGLAVLSVEFIFFASNLTKLFEGGLMPVAVGFAIFTLLMTWKHGNVAVADARRRINISMQDFLLNDFAEVPRVAGTAVYLTSDPSLVPSALFHNLKHYKVMHENTLFLHVLTEDTPVVRKRNRLHIETLSPNVFLVTLRFGFREEPNVVEALRPLESRGIPLNPMLTSYFVARNTIVDGPGVLPRWQAGLFGWMYRQSEGVAGYFKLPANNVVELGTQVIL